MRLINGWDKNVCRASSKDGAFKVPIRLDDRIVEDVTKNAREVLAIARRGAKVIFPDVFKLYQELEKTL